MPNTIVKTIDGKSVAFSKLTRRQLMNITAKKFAEIRAAKVKDLEDAGASPETRHDVLSELRKTEGGVPMLLAHVKTFEGASEIIQTSIDSTSGLALKADDLDMTTDEFLVLAGELCGFVFEEAKPADADDDDDSDGFPTRPHQSATG